MNEAVAYPYNDQNFRAMFSAFADATCYPEPLVSMYYDIAGEYVQNVKGPSFGLGKATPLALNYMTAHLLQIGAQISEGQDSGITVAATIDKISTTMQQMTLPNQWQYWLGSTEYGRQLLALLQVKSVGGFYIPGGPGRAGFRC